MSRPTRDSAAGRAYLDLQNQARRQKRGTQELLTMYIVERWLSRMSRSTYAEDFILKGGMLLASFGARRPTVDADALARNMAPDQETVARRVAEIAAIEDSDDGVEFLHETATTAVIRDDALYSGVRVTMTARLATAQVKLRLDINFGDPVTPAPRTVALPSLRSDAPPIRILGYPIETVLAEKIVTAIELGRANTRVRDFADVHLLTGTQTLQCGALRTDGYRRLPRDHVDSVSAGRRGARSAAQLDLCRLPEGARRGGCESVGGVLRHRCCRCCLRRPGARWARCQIHVEPRRTELEHRTRRAVRADRIRYRQDGPVTVTVEPGRI